jgi:glycosyltransferase involved in cell wall biosynthesis
LEEPEIKIDMCMWAKNGERFLPYVLRMIDKVIPEESICQRIFVDDHSTDDTRDIAKDFNWKVFINPKSGIGSGADEALRHVKQDFMVSFEQDILLDKEWWDKIAPQILSSRKILTVQGIRLATSKTVRIMEKIESGERFFSEAFSLDNNIWNVKALKVLGGFPHYPISVDRRLKAFALRNGYEWKVDSSVVSWHLRKGAMDYVRQYRTRCLLEECTPNDYLLYCTFSQMIRLLLRSPFSALRLLWQTKHPNMAFAYPLYRLMAIDNFALRRRVCNQRQLKFINRRKPIQM